MTPHGIRVRLRTLACLATLVTGTLSCPADNLIENASFDKKAEHHDATNQSADHQAADHPASWATRVWSGCGEFQVAPGGRNDEACGAISSTDGGDLSWQQKITLDQPGVYRLSGWVKTDQLVAEAARGALLSIHELPSVATEAVSGATDWTELKIDFQVYQSAAVTVNCLYGGWGQSTGTAWYDDVRVERVGDLPDFEPAVSIDAEQTGAPINPFIYGQFIEHLGRCIYGGIWAEMLEDRKFYFPITTDYDPYQRWQQSRFPVVGKSPWQIIGPDGSITMDASDSYVGEHTPLIRSGAAIQQNDLALVKGQRYAGYILLKSPQGTGVARLTLAGARGDIRIDGIGRNYRKHRFAFTAAESTDTSSLKIAVEHGSLLVGTVSLMPDDHLHGMRRDSLQVLKELNAPMYRWPGGNFVSGYDWRDGIGDRDRRPPRRNPAWTGVEHNDFGTDEFLLFCQTVGAEPLITVNTGFGDAYSAAQWVEYCNGTSNTIGGRWRSENGRAQPYGVTFWCVGNEMYGKWQLGHMSLDHYVQKHNRVARAMRSADPSVKLIGVGSLAPPSDQNGWSRGMLENCAESMDYISEHFYHGRPRNGDQLFQVVPHVGLLKESIRQKAEGHRRLQEELKIAPRDRVPIAMDEWNYWHRPYEYGELGCVYDLADALGVAAALHEYYRQSDMVWMAHYAQTVNVIGCVKTTKTKAFFATTGLPLMLYRRHFGTHPVQVEGDFEELGMDVMAAKTDNGQALTIGVVNPLPRAKTVHLNLSGCQPSGTGQVWTIAGDDPRDFNAPEHPDRVKIASAPLTSFSSEVHVAPYSISVLRLDLE